MNNLGFCYANGYGVKENRQQAFEWFKKAAKKGNLEGMLNLAKCYDSLFSSGGRIQNRKEAFEWFKKAAENGNSFAMNNLGDCYWLGIGVKSYDEAFKWYKMAAENGNPEGMQNLAEFYYAGLGVQYDRKMGNYWINKKLEKEKETEAKGKTASIFIES